MDLNIYDLTFLLGYSYLQTLIIENRNSKIDIFSLSQSLFAKYLPQLLRSLYEKNSLNNPIRIYPSNYLYLLMKKESRQSGHCLLCDSHYSHIRSHYRTTHHLEYNDVETIFSIVGDSSIYFMPAEFRQANLTKTNKEDQGNLVNFRNDLVENEQEITDEQLQGFYIIKHTNWKEIEIICADCGLMMEKKHALIHRNEHLNNMVDENSYSGRKKRSKIKNQVILL